MRFYIPELGDKIVLTSNWTFNLHNEHRNRGVWDGLKCDAHPDAVRWTAELAALEDEYKKILGRGKIVTGAPYGLHNRIRKEDQKRYDEVLYRLCDMRCGHVGVPVTLPKGTELTVDRIYIRKGASEFSSVTFYITDCPHKALRPVKKGGGPKRGRLRFWAKLGDCNTIEFRKLGEKVA